MFNDLDVEKYSRHFKDNRRVKIDNFLDLNTAEQYFKDFKELAWETIFLTSQGLGCQEPEDFLNIPEGAIVQNAEKGFGYYYDNFKVSRKAAIGEPDICKGVRDWETSEDFLSIFKEITNLNNIHTPYLNISRYCQNHFLTHHDDHTVTDFGKRKIAFSLHLTPEWEAHWGGQTVFIDKDNYNKILRTISPEFNVMHIWEVKEDDHMHFVSMVSPFSNKCRYAISGWLHE